MDEIRKRCLSLVPDLPLWVETRDLLLWEDSKLIENASKYGFVVWSPEDELGSVVGEPEAHALTQAAQDVSELLAFADNIDHVQSLLTEFDSELATIFSEPVQLPLAPPHTCREINISEIAAHDHLPDDLLSELTDAAEDDAVIVAAFDGELPVAFAYVASETESLWDVSIDTIQSHRRQGYATAAVIHLMTKMRENGKSAVWGSMESNCASSSLAHRLGFVESGKLWVLSRNDT